MKLGKAIRVARVRKGLRQGDLAKKLGVTATYISLLEHDKRDPSWSFLERLAKALDIPLPMLLLLANDGNTRKHSLLDQVLRHELMTLAFPGTDPGRK